MLLLRPLTDAVGPVVSALRQQAEGQAQPVWLRRYQRYLTKVLPGAGVATAEALVGVRARADVVFTPGTVVNCSQLEPGVILPSLVVPSTVT